VPQLNEFTVNDGDGSAGEQHEREEVSTSFHAARLFAAIVTRKIAKEQQWKCG